MSDKDLFDWYRRGADAANVAAFELCLKKLPLRDIDTALDVRFGHGGWAKAFSMMCPDAELYGFEWDVETYSAAEVPPRTKLVNRKFDTVTFPREWPRHYDLLCANFNTLTMLKCDPLLRALDIARPRFLIFTDVACSKLHLSYKSYGLKSHCRRGDLEHYFDAFGSASLPGWERVGIARTHFHAATAAWIRKTKD